MGKTLPSSAKFEISLPLLSAKSAAERISSIGSSGVTQRLLSRPSARTYYAGDEWMKTRKAKASRGVLGQLEFESGKNGANARTVDFNLDF